MEHIENKEMTNASTTVLPKVWQLLKTRGYEVTRTEHGLRCDLSLMGRRIGTAVFISAELILNVARETSPIVRAFSPLWDDIFGAAYFDGSPRVDQYLYVVATAESRKALADLGAIDSIEGNMSYARKTVCLLDELDELFTNPFVTLVDEMRANAEPKLLVLPELSDRKVGTSRPTEALGMFDSDAEAYAGKLVEIGPVRQMIETPKHPYTKLLVDSLPGIEVKQALVGIPGLPPPLVDLPPGCSFSPRCPFAFARCVSETPLLQDVGPQQRAACHLYPEHRNLPPLPERARREQPA